MDDSQSGRNPPKVLICAVDARMGDYKQDLSIHVLYQRSINRDIVPPFRQWHQDQV